MTEKRENRELPNDAPRLVKGWSEKLHRRLLRNSFRRPFDFIVSYWDFESNSVQIEKWLFVELNTSIQIKHWKLKNIFSLTCFSLCVNKCLRPLWPLSRVKDYLFRKTGEFTGLSLVRHRATESHNKEKHHRFNKLLWLRHRRSGDLGFWIVLRVMAPGVSLCFTVLREQAAVFSTTSGFLYLPLMAAWAFVPIFSVYSHTYLA